MEVVHGLKCLITDPTRIAVSTETLIDVILTNKQDLFEQRGVIFPEISNHGLIYGLMKEKVHQHAHGNPVMSKETKNFEFRRINQIEVKETLDKINASKSKGPSRFSPRFLTPLSTFLDKVSNMHIPLKIFAYVQPKDFCAGHNIEGAAIHFDRVSGRICLTTHILSSLHLVSFN